MSDVSNSKQIVPCAYKLFFLKTVACVTPFPKPFYTCSDRSVFAFSEFKKISSN